MSTTDLGRFSADDTLPLPREISSTSGFAALRALLMPLASLRLTVVLFALSLILVLAGTLAQVDHDIWFVVHNYFRTLFAWINFQVFFPRAWEVPGGFYFPGGWLLGGAMGVNLLAAHALRFKVTAKGSALVVGLSLLTVGVILTWFVVQSGLDDTVESELSPEFCNGLWHALRFALGAGSLGFSYALALNYRHLTQAGASWLWWLGAVVCALLLGIAVWLFVNPEAQLDPSGLRILWRLIKAGAVGLVLLAGCYWTFGRRAGIVLLHGSIALLMFSELWTGLESQESQMRIVEGQTVTYAEDHRSAEFVVVDKSDPKQDQITAVPLPILQDALENEKPINDPALPFVIRVIQQFPNVSTRFLQPGEQSLANRGVGLLKVAESTPINTGVGQAEGVDVPAIYAELISKDDGEKSLGTYLFSPFLPEESLKVADIPYEVALQFKRIHKPYSVKLIDFRHDRYVGTGKAKNFSSEVQLLDPERNVDRTFKIWMNNPLRYGGDTLYQASFDPNNSRATTLQVMTNPGWMIPYVSCMLVATGMLAQFGATFWRFARRESAPKTETQVSTFRELVANWKSPTVWVPALILLGFAGYVFRGARVPELPATEMQIHEFGQLPVAYNGRVKPFDTLARNALTVLSDKGSREIDKYADPQTQSKYAIAWLLDFLTDSNDSEQQRILRIDNLDVLNTLNLEPREGFRYSLSELKESGNEYMKQWQLASKVPENERTLAQVKFFQLARKVVLINTLQESFSSPAIRTGSFELMKIDFQQVEQQIERLQSGAPRAVPPVEAGQAWQTMLEAERDALFARVKKTEVNAATISLRTILDAYAAGDVQKFNEEVAAYKKIVEERAAADAKYDAEAAATAEFGGRKTAEKLQVNRLEFETFFNHFNPFYNAMILYVLAFVLASCSWLGWNTLLNRSANWLLWFTFVLHTYALICRIYISGRPPVTNLYSSAVFIGWGAVLFALVFERIYRFGIGNLLAAAVGFPTLFVAYNLAGDGDTFEVLQAVLDTQFWLATHVVCITLGYSTTYLAGGLGLIYVIMGLVLGRLDEDQRKQLTRMTYGTLCFATFFSFVGTVLGGLWGDDSWGRFWGWDPKENGALMIVIWNALVLHARWGAMVRQRGLAVLAIFGNVVTAWSWFGTNQLGVGLHAYGFRKGMTFWLCMFVLSQLFVMALGCLPERFWGGRDRDETAPQSA